jgi:hypothetical protein
MKEGRELDVEKLLESVAPEPAPHGLKGRVLRAVQEHRAGRAVLSPLLRLCFAGCTVILVIAIAADAALERRENAGLTALLGPQIQPEEQSIDSVLFGDIFGGSPSAAGMLELRILLTGERPDFRIRSYVNQRVFFEEDINGHENKENIL